jgi:hypothetical protein
VVQRDRTLPRQFDILLLEKAAGRWTRATLDADHLPRAEETPGLAWWGSIVGVTHTSRHLLVEAHVSPSAAATLVLTRSLEPRGVFYGWPLFSLQSGAVAYYRSQAHFAPTHPFELCVFDPATRADRMVYPLKPYDEPRRAFIAQMRAAYAKAGDAWCRDHNHHCDPERFDAFGGRDWAVDASREAMAFTVTFGNTSRGGGPDDWVPHIEVAVVCRNTTRTDAIVCRETPLETLQRANPGVPVRGLLQLAIMEQVQRASAIATSVAPAGAPERSTPSRRGSSTRAKAPSGSWAIRRTRKAASAITSRTSRCSPARAAPPPQRAADGPNGSTPTNPR